MDEILEGLTLTVGADRGLFEVRVSIMDTPTGRPLHIHPTHDGLIALAQTIEALPRVEVMMEDVLDDPRITGLPSDFDAVGFVQAALTLGRGGWKHSVGGSC